MGRREDARRGLDAAERGLLRLGRSRGSGPPHAPGGEEPSSRRRVRPWTSPFGTATHLRKPMAEPIRTPETADEPQRETNIIGKPFRRVDGRAKVTGATKFADDLSFPRMCYVRLVRSHPAARDDQGDRLLRGGEGPRLPRLADRRGHADPVRHPPRLAGRARPLPGQGPLRRRSRGGGRRRHRGRGLRGGARG